VEKRKNEAGNKVKEQNKIESVIRSNTLGPQGKKQQKNNSLKIIFIIQKHLKIVT
jgi:hypothetical protein